MECSDSFILEQLKGNPQRGLTYISTSGITEVRRSANELRCKANGVRIKDETQTLIYTMSIRDEKFHLSSHIDKVGHKVVCWFLPEGTWIC